MGGHVSVAENLTISTQLQFRGLNGWSSSPVSGSIYIVAPSSVEALFRRESIPPTSSFCRQTTTGGAKSGELSDGSFGAEALSDPQLSVY